VRILKYAAVVASTVAVSLAFVGAADAAKVKVESTVFIGSFDSAFNNFYIAGNVESEKKKCVAGREIQLEMSYSDKPTKVVDVGVTSQNGGYGLVAFDADADNIEAIEVTVFKKKIKVSKNKTLVCGEDLAFIV